MTIHTYGFLIAIGFLVAIWLAIIQAKKEGVPPDKIIDLGFYILLAAIVGSRLFFVLINVGHYINNPLDIFKIWEGGLVFYGGVLLAVPVAVWHIKKSRMDLWRTADIFAPSIAIGHFFGRLGCLAAGCCHGKPAEDIPWGIIFTDPECLAPLNMRLHPTQLYESAGEFLIFLSLVLVRAQKSFNGQLFMMYLVLYAVLRFFVEFFRGDAGRGFIAGGLSVSQGISLLLFVTGIAGFFILKKKNIKL